MKVTEALEKRKSVRAYLDKAVEPEKISTILDAARHAPSGVNTQPWQVAVVSGETKQKLQEKIEATFRGGDKGKADYGYYPNEWKEPFISRRKECGLLMYKTLGIERTDRERQTDQWAANYRAFDAPVMLLFFMDSAMQEGSYMDYGMFLQSVMLAAVEQGLATCPQASIADYPEIIKSELAYADDTILLCGIALGYEDTEALVNSYRTSREDVDSFTKYFT
jgi:nitroreductase